MEDGVGGHLRIGELARRVGLKPSLLRAWEKRYGLLAPVRSPGGLRLYSAADEARVKQMQLHLASGMAAAEAARVARQGAPRTVPEAPRASVELGRIADDLRTALDEFDDATAHTALDRLFGAYGLETALNEVVLPYLRSLGERWAEADATVVDEHFASNLIRGRLQAFTRGWDNGRGPGAVLACPSGELHDLPLLCFGVVLRGRGWRITYLGADTPIAAIRPLVRISDSAVVVLAAVSAERFCATEDEIRELAGRARVALGGAGASSSLARRVGAEALEPDLVAAAAALAP
jgi:MerR family transcriptional regulator, light-induced transcriptional regulator